jgi:site-specific DNA recombinase
MTFTTPKFFLYARKSTDEASRQILSIEAQLFELRELAKREGIEIVREFVESRTAKTPGRPVFNAMLAEVEAGKAQGILAWHPDRLARNSIDGGRIVYLVDIGTIQDLKFPTFRFEATANGKFMLNIAFSQSKYYVDNLSENIKRGMRQKLRNGIWPQYAPLGYVNDRANRCIIVDETKAPLVRKAFQLYATGNHSVAHVREAINDAGLKGRRERTLSVQNYHVILTNPVYYGMMRFNGEVFEGKHDPIISKKLFDQVQEILTRKSKPKTPTLIPYLYRGLFRCGSCGCFITTEQQKGHNYLRCTKRKGNCTEKKYVREEVITDEVEEVLSTLAIPDDAADWLFAQIETEAVETETSIRIASESSKLALKECESKLDALLDLVLEKAISQSEYLPKKEILLKEKIALREKIAALAKQGIERFEPAKWFVKSLKQSNFHDSTLTVEQKRDLLKKTGSNLTVASQHLTVSFKNPWKLVSEWNASPHSGADISGEHPELLKWRREGDSNPRYCLGTRAFQARALNHSAISPPTSASIRCGTKGIQAIFFAVAQAVSRQTSAPRLNTAQTNPVH